MPPESTSRVITAAAEDRVKPAETITEIKVYTLVPAHGVVIPRCTVNGNMHLISKKVERSWHRTNETPIITTNRRDATPPRP